MSLYYSLGVHDEQLAASVSVGRSAVAKALGLNPEADVSLLQVPSLSWLPALQETWFDSAKGWFQAAPDAWFKKLKDLELPIASKQKDDPGHFVTARLTFSNARQAEAYKKVLGEILGETPNGSGPKRLRFGTDPRISALDVWSPIGPGGGIFGDRALADNLTGVDALRWVGATGRGVNVVIVDRGLNRGWVESTVARMSARRGLRPRDGQIADVYGWTRVQWRGAYGESEPHFIHPGATGSEHGHMVARNVLAVAPEATIWDAPLLPPEGDTDAPPSPSVASALFYWINQSVRAGTMLTFDSRTREAVKVDTSGPWVVVNAWGVLDPGGDPSFEDNYADNPDHPLVNDMEQFERKDDTGRIAQVDVVFAAGNCGEPCPDLRCGREDCGPGRSILGLNAHPKVLTVGAVRTDGMPVAFSAQGPGRLAAKQGSRKIYDYRNDPEARNKPDLCAPSHFRESDNDAEVNTGTSAACGYAAGIVAALRSIPQGRSLKPQRMRCLLRETAQQPNGAPSGWDPRLGHGIISAQRAIQFLERHLPDSVA
jgi:Subtilase family